MAVAHMRSAAAEAEELVAIGRKEGGWGQEEGKGGRAQLK